MCSTHERARARVCIRKFVCAEDLACFGIRVRASGWGVGVSMSMDGRRACAWVKKTETGSVLRFSFTISYICA